MTLVRMQLAHGVMLSPGERHSLVRLLSESNGLAPSEAAAQRPILERRPAYVESPPDADLAVMCARCHTWGRVALQRRSEAEWLKHVHFHVGQFVTLEYQASARDRDWFDEAVTKVVPTLARMFPVKSDAWTQWRAAPRHSAAGQWVAFGHRPGTGAFSADLSVRQAGDRYDLTMTMQDAGGRSTATTGQAIVYTGFEWRARMGEGAAASMQIMAMSEDGQSMSGRWFDEANDALGAQVVAVRTDGASQVLGTIPDAVRIGAKTPIVIVGRGLKSDLSLAGLQLSEVAVNAAGTRASATVAVPADARQGPVALGSAARLMVYNTIDSLRVEPAEAIARVGGNGGPIGKVPAQFDAIAYANGPDGKPATDDDLRIGVVPARWSVENFDDQARHDEDARYSGSIDAATGLFQPAGAGPNPARRFGTNNVGNLKVIARIDERDQALQADARLVVTVQRFNDPPIR